MEIGEARLLFKFICEQMSQQRLVVTGEGRKETANFNLEKKVGKLGTVGSVQYYGGKAAIANGKIRAISLRFYNNALSELNLRPLFDGLYNYRVADAEDYLSFEFLEVNDDVKRLICIIAALTFSQMVKRYGEKYLEIPIQECSLKLWELPRV